MKNSLRKLSLALLLVPFLTNCQEEDQLPTEVTVVAETELTDKSSSKSASVSDNWKLVWSDEFSNSGAPNPSKWNYERGYVRNNELQYFTDRPENVRVSDGKLIIEARRDYATVDGAQREITSASVTTRNIQSWQYGKIDIRAKLPASLGTWPALWMLPNSWPSIVWPLCGEIDIMKHVGYDPDYVHTTVHTEANNHTKGNQLFKSTYLPDVDDAFHNYGIEWNDQKIDFFVDGGKVYTVSKNGNTIEEWPFDQPFYLIMNLSFGGSWGGLQGVDKSSLPQTYLVDYVRVYERNGTTDIPPSGSNITINNPGFESGTNGWTGWNYNSDTYPFSGAYGGTAWWGGYMEQTITGLQPNTEYTLAAKARRFEDGVSGGIGVKNYGGNNQTASTSSATYTDLSISFTTGNNNTSAVIQVIAPSNGMVVVDDFTITKASSRGDNPSDMIVRARGVVGGEQLQLMIDGVVTETWTLSTNMNNYTYSGSVAGKNVQLRFSNDTGGSFDVKVDYLQIDGQTYQAEAQASNTGVWQNGSCGGSYSDWLHCNGAIDFGTF